MHRDWTPPLADDLFGVRPGVLHTAVRDSMNENFQRVLERYPRAEGFASILRPRLEHEPLEALLREFRDTNEPHYLRGYQQVPLYLQELLGSVSQWFTTAPDNLNVLVGKVITADFEKVAFITLNYDLLLERALVTAGDSSSKKRVEQGLDWYTKGSSNWMVAKLHGSVDWGRPVLNQLPNEYSGSDLDRSLELLDDHFVRDLGLGGIDLVPGYSSRWINDVFYYPALAVPVDDKYQPVCPADHLGALRDFLYDCPNFLFVGSIVRDSDLLDVLETANDCKALGIVGKQQADVNMEQGDVNMALRSLQAIRVFEFGARPQLSTDGFSAFVSSGKLDDFIKTCAPTG